jgi:hypothetical protein
MINLLALSCKAMQRRASRMSKHLRTGQIAALVAFAAAAAACAPAQPTGTPAAIPELAGRTAGPPQSCVSIDSTASLRIVDPGTVLYTTGSTVWLNRLATQCPGVSGFDILVTHPTGSQYCRGDFVQSVDPVSKIPGPSCVLGDFIPYRR